MLTIVGPAMPRIVAELGGMDHYSWVATAAMLVSAISVPIVGKLSDLYGRGGRSTWPAWAIFIGGSILGRVRPELLGGLWSVPAPSRAWAWGLIMPLSQTIVGDIIPPRQRG